MVADPRRKYGAPLEDDRYPWLGAGWNFAPRTVYKTADQATTSTHTTFRDDTHLKLPVLAAAAYQFVAEMWVVSGVTTTGVKLAINGPTIGTGTMQYELETALTVGASGAAGTVGRQYGTAYDAALVGATVPSTTVPSRHTLRGVIFTGATAGLLVVRLAAEVDAVVTYRKGSSLTLTRLPL